MLVAVQLPGITDVEHREAMIELERLTRTLGLTVVAKLSQKRRTPAPGTVLGRGKIDQLAAITGGPGWGEEADAQDEDADLSDNDASASAATKADIVICDLEISPNQMQNLEKMTGVEVLDRTGLILEIFNRHARSREARLQVELAKLKYMAPRLRASRVGGDRQGGGIGAKGAGETAHELDRRRIRDRISELRAQLDTIHQEQQTRRAQRIEMNCVALVGYTNAGKSSLMRALTGSEVLVEDKLFATLDTTVRNMVPETTPRILISDTVGFISKLPHDLVASFRSTLDEALSAGLLLFVVDASDPNFRAQLATTQTVLTEIGASELPRMLVLNKMDRLTEDEKSVLVAEFPDAWPMSTRNPQDVEATKSKILEFFEREMIEGDQFVPYAQGHVLKEIRSKARVLHEDHQDEGTLFRLRASPATLEWIRNYVKAAP